MLPLRLTPQLVRHQVRHYRRIKTGLSSTSDARDEAILKKLESQLAELKAKMKQEEQDAIDIANQHSKDKDSEIENHAAYFWERILTPEDRNQLAGHDIHSMQDLERAYFEADVKMTTKPFPKLEQLPPKFQIAHELHKSIPHRVNTHRKAKAMGLKSFFGGIF
ncbi:hypothetical protein Moror_17631 [Moniliophthora roreri MCA 2997]|uniref:Uncharacterized protein n=1 Tax=Moniliophthora roreri (strain MCA 2997) TaxID=1381753 RepID=V2XUK3_MONRO|nr:hypothetical protein Moror_17631 [Moniliophthora roreri MCA 2997]